MNSTSPICSPSATALIPTFNYLVYTVFMPLRFILGFSGQLIALLAFRKQISKDGGYIYQSVVSIGRLIDITYYPISVIFQQHLPKWPWANFYSLYWFSAHLNGVFYASFYSLCMFLSTMMGVDRALALTKPFQYKNWNHKKRAYITVVITVFVSSLSSTDSAWRWYVEHKNGQFVVSKNNDYYNSLVGQVTNNIRNFIRVTAVVVLVISYIIIIWKYTTRMKKVEALTNRSMTDQKKEKQGRKHQKTLFILVTFEIPFMVLSVSMTVTIVFLTTYAPQLQACYGTLLASLGQFCVEIVDMLEVYLMFLVCKEFRKLVFKVIPLLEKVFVKTAVVTLNHTK